MKFKLSIFFIFCYLLGISQPLPCGNNPQMTSTCATACVICDIDGFTGINDLTATGQSFPGFCTTQYNNMQYIAFIAGSVDLTIQVEVGTCTGGINSLEVGFFESFDCETFTPITFCDTDIQSNENVTFSTNQPLTIGQHYYLVIDGSNGANCSWTFNVLAGTTEVLPLTTSGVISHVEETCPDIPIGFKTVTGEFGAAFFLWTLDGQIQSGSADSIDINFPSDGTYEICVTAANVCDQAPPSCTTIKVRTPDTLFVDEVLCLGDCIEFNNTQFCTTGSFTESIPLPIGCDSTISLKIEVLDQPLTNLNAWICNIDSFVVGDSIYTETGMYNNVVLTVNDCDSIVNLELLVIECEIMGTPGEIPVICKGTATGTLLFSVDQGEPPLTYTYTNIADPTITGTGTTNLLVNNEIPGIPAGSYQIYISDNFGNDVVIPMEVTEPPYLEIELVPSDFGGFNVSCFSTNGLPGDDGFLEAIPTGGVPPYTYVWSNGQLTDTATNLNPINYEVVVTDSVGCTQTANYTLTSPPAIDPLVLFTDPNCEGFDTGEIEIASVMGGTPDFTFSLSDTTGYTNSNVFMNLTEGSYEVFIQDANGCITSVASEIIAPQIPVIDFIEDLTISLADSIMLDPIINQITINNISWTPVDFLSCLDCLTPFASPINDATYNITITSIDDCSSSADINIQVDKIRRVFIPNVFSPDGDGINESIIVFGGPEVAAVLRFNIYDRWGNLIHEQTDFPVNDPTFEWDGRFKNQKLNPGLFVYIAEVLFIDGVTLSYTGDISLLR